MLEGIVPRLSELVGFIVMVGFKEEVTLGS